jgi:hypothetical protein
MLQVLFAQAAKKGGAGRSCKNVNSGYTSRMALKGDNKVAINLGSFFLLLHPQK